MRLGWFKRAAGSLVAILLPPRCVACGDECEPARHGPLFCVSCQAGLELSRRLACPRCATFRADVDLARGDCGDCRSRKLLYAAARAIGPYDALLRQAVLQAKHASCEPLAAALGQRLAEAIEQQPFAEPPDAVIAVPLFWSERMRRRCNPASTIAEAAARQLRLPFLRHAFVCRRPLQRQATLSAPQRQQNVRGAFRVWRKHAIAGKRILLIDDVMTTGATAHEVARGALAAGATCIYVATVARSTPEF